MKRAIFFDIDGTLIDCLNGLTDITPRVKKAIRALQSNGDYIFIATGRPYAFLSEALLNFGFDGFILTNGAQVKVNNKLIYKESVSKDFVKEIANDFERLNIEYILQGEIYSYMKENCKELYSFFDSCSISRRYFKSIYDIENVDTLR